MKDYRTFLDAYRQFKRSIDLEKRGILPELSKLLWYILMGIPPVPADEYSVPNAQEIAIDQRIAILKAIFVEINRDQPDEFIDRGLEVYDTAGRLAKELLREEMADELAQFLDRYIKSHPYLDNDDII